MFTFLAYHPIILYAFTPQANPLSTFIEMLINLIFNTGYGR